MLIGIYRQEKQYLLPNIVNESKGNYLLLDFALSYQANLQSESFKKLIEDRRIEFVPVCKSTEGTNTIFRIDKGSR